jgi:hypothetical protein
VGIIPDQEFMSTESGRHLAIIGQPGEVDWTAMDFSGMENNN